jgi:hypothetical protein
MRYLMMLAAAASLAACHNRSQDETGAAPQRGDTTAVTASDTTKAVPTDSTMGAQPSATDTSRFKVSDSTSVGAGVTADSAYAPKDTTSAHAWDSTSVSPSDTTKKQ